METKTKIICTTICSVISTLVLGEVFGNAISRPIAAWKYGRTTMGIGVAVVDALHHNIVKSKKEEEA